MFASDPDNGVTEIHVAQGTYKPDHRAAARGITPIAARNSGWL